MKVVPKRTFLFKQNEVEGGKREDVIAHKGVKIEMTEKEAVRFWGSLDLNEVDKKKLLTIAKQQKLQRLV